MKTVLIFDTSIDGHHLEYIHHLHEAWVKSEDNLVICVPSKFVEVRNNFNWSEGKNISYSYLDDEIIEKLSHSGRIAYAYRASILLLRKCNEIQPNVVFLISLLQFLPILPFLFLFRKEKISGIFYKIYLYCWHKYTIKEKICEILRYGSVVMLNSVVNVFILNDLVSTRKLNINWHSNKFHYLPDPLQSDFKQKIELCMGLNPKATIVLHFGALSKRKGTLEILDAIDIICKTGLKVNTFQFVFAGSVHSSIRDEFYEKYNSLKERVSILLFDRFCSYEEINYLCENANIILAPYNNVYSSSGVVSYAAKYGKPIIVPNDGLLGKIVKRYQLGLAVDNLNSNSLAKILLSDNPILINRERCKLYIELNSIDNFANTIINRL